MLKNHHKFHMNEVEVSHNSCWFNKRLLDGVNLFAFDFRPIFTVIHSLN